MANIKSNTSVLTENINLKNLEIVDVGSGDGKLVRYMTKQGAQVTGLECGALQLEKARSTPPQGNEVYIEGFGQDMPFESAIFDVVIFFNSLHHVPVEHMKAALSEASRVVKKGGTVYVAEPVASGSGFELHAPIDDETVVRAAAYDVIRQAPSLGCKELREVFYDTIYHYGNFSEFKEEMIRIEPRRRVLFDGKEDELQDSFNLLGIPNEKGFRFDQPMRVNILERLS